MLRKKIKKLLCFLVAIIIAFSLFSVSAFAVNVDPSTSISGFNIRGMNIILSEDGNNIPLSIIAKGSGTTSSDGFGSNSVSVSCVRTDGLNFNEGSVYSVIAYMFVEDDFLLTNQSYVVGSFQVANYSSLAVDSSIPFPAKAYRYSSTSSLSSSHPQQSVVSNNIISNSAGNFNNYTFSFSNGDLGVSYDRYTCNFNLKFLQSSSDTIVFRFHSFYFKTISSEEAAAESIKNNQDKNTDKILNGGHDEPSYSSTDRTATDEYEAKSKEIEDKTVEARSSVVSVFSNFDILLGDLSINKGLLAVSTIFTEFLSIKWLNDIIQFALGLGAFSFLLGSVIMVVGRVSSNKAATERKTERDRNTAIKNDYFKARTAYYNSRRKK